MPSSSVPVNRLLVGALAVGLSVAGLVIAFADSFDNPYAGGLLRTGVLLGALWLALPTRTREAAWANISIWTLFGFVLLVVVLVRQPKLFVVLVGLMVAGAVLIRPKRR
jgi:uncharacterized protein (DUF983 family)